MANMGSKELSVKDFMQSLMSGVLSDDIIESYVLALNEKGVTAENIFDAATVMRQFSKQVVIQDKTHLVDTCGTGGDGIQTFNVSTLSAIVAASAGVKVAKHGGRSVSSKCGSADVLEVLGVNVNLTADKVASLVNEIGIAFMFAPNFHPAMRYAAPVRKKLGIRTIFNVLGPLANPALATRQVLGVYDKSLTQTMAEVLSKLGSEHVMVVHGEDGMDEISISSRTTVTELKNKTITTYTIQPSDFGLDVADLKTIQVENAEASKAMMLDVLNGSQGPHRNITILNAGAAIYISGISSTLKEGIAKAASVIDQGLALKKLEALKVASHG
ncbi:anthranilate phosphoribosyltransferase [Candidatus Methylopumilus universalis]|uniref:Anthranilate phosphoribosyltransferase n=1 Tax=Candidatus Methylopumilus universalis TaxID=2588536 RepID=A0AAX1F1H7_9PROT|nr:anthranilate phosphoribosyltransferase [Candidatus Methylopumilus universalis]MCX7191979.1 anthranilate phosphoribosyltransferase [Candidatus Methylopumilus sp.]QDC41594.1 anthranilate phosphoribosyltransferase [Candidatus Methylopumilus universalis]QDC42875.1 anthranilate phosphoribosyltransferase [Candidatus Methylopumilus universalis]QDC55264.1 anthranilate phosphoribosyltransferase [Candidatus Methylopumilus universalis]QDC56543.1 anthranilate phosphoribosyltransferase [Candidatus Methy